jgi:hypothetical protein
VQENELLPWHWQIQQGNTGVNLEPKHCASTVAKLGAFAAVNIAMAIVTPIIGRRDVIKKLTFGCMGRRGSKLWLLTGPLTAILHISSNAIAALIIKKTPGYSDINIGALILLWCTRPRLAWLVVVLLPWGAKDFIYFSVAASTLLAEVALQLIGSYYMGYATQYARKQKFYRKGRLNNVPHGQDAWVMYAGSLLWLSVIVFALIACALSVFNIDRHVASFVGTVLNGQKRKARKFSARCKAQSAITNRSIALLRPFEVSDSAVLQKFNLLLPSEEYLMLSNFWSIVDEKWDQLVKYLEDDLPALRKQEKRLERMKKKLNKRSSRRSTSENQTFELEFQAATQRFQEIKSLLNNMPGEALEAIMNVVNTIDSSEAQERLTTALGNIQNLQNRGAQRNQGILNVTPEERRVLEKLKRDLEALQAGWQIVGNTFPDPLELIWKNQEQAREKEEAERKRDPSERLTRIAMTTVSGMFGCWVAQWVWWIGYIRVAADS